MQYILTEEEYNTLKSGVVGGLKKDVVAKAQVEFVKELVKDKQVIDGKIVVSQESLVRASDVFDKIIATG